MQGKDFRSAVTRQQPLMGTFVKTPSPHGIEIIGGVGLDFVVIDAEHAPFDKSAIDLGVLAAHAHGITAMVRVGGIDGILNALDCGATGVMVPHIDSPAAARAAADAARYRPGRRGFSSSGRSGRYGRNKFSEHMSQSDGQTTVVAMLEDADAIGQIEGIVAVDGIDAFFLGRGDLTAALGASASSDQIVQDAVVRLAQAVRKAGKPLWAYSGGTAELKYLAELGVSGFIVSSDQGFMRRAAETDLQAFRAAMPPSAV